MIRTYYTITLRSYLNHSSGEGDLHVNNDIATDFVGLPIISGRAIKGLLRESLEETLERKQKSDDKEIAQFFGVGGYDQSTNAIKFISNAVIDDYRNTFLELYNSNISPHQVKDFYTKILSQTRIDTDGTAKDGSLRFTRVVDPLIQGQLHFYIDSTIDLDKSEIFNSTVLNLRHAGVNRNRGLGSIELAKFKSEKINEWVKPHFEVKTSLSVEVSLKAPVLLPKKIGDQNTSYSEDCIRGNILLGALAYDYLKKGNVVDNDFLDAFVLGGLVFEDLTKNGAKQFPRLIAKNKYSDKNEYLSIDQLDAQAENISLKKESGYLSEKGEKVAIDKMFSFHIARNENRLAGTSTKEQGAIFYYEYLVPFQNFQGHISETKAGLLKRIVNKIGVKMTLMLGASKSTQYGEINLEMNELSSDPEPQRGYGATDAYYLVLESPCLIYNTNGFPSLNSADLQSYLPPDFLMEPIETKTEFSQRFNGQWKCKSAKESTWLPGSTFFITGDFKTKSLPARIGEQTHTGFGNYTLYTKAELQNLITQLNTKVEEIKNENQSATSKLVQELNNQQKTQELANLAIQKALKYIGKEKNLPNSLLHQVKQQLADQNAFVAWISKIEKKSAGDKLIKAGWYESLCKAKTLTPENYAVFQPEWLEIVKQQMSTNRQNLNNGSNE